MKTQCPNCKSKFNVNETSIGKQAKCPKCTNSFVIQPFVDTPVVADFNPNSSESVESPAKTKGPVKKTVYIVLSVCVIWLGLAVFNPELGAFFTLLIVTWFVIAAYKSTKKKKKDQKDKIDTLFRQMKDIYANARKGDITRPIGDTFFSCADEVLAIIPKIPVKNGDEKYQLMEAEIEKMSNQITMLLGLHATTTRVASLGDEIEKLATLRKQGVISDHEFQAFSERFKLATGEKASSVIKAISELYEQHQKGAILEGNYHAALWSLLDKLDRKI